MNTASENAHDFILCDRPECAANPDEHCQFVWCGAPRNHPSHTCYEQDRLHGLDACIGDVDHPLTTWPTYGGISRKDGEKYISGMRDFVKEKMLGEWPVGSHIDKETGRHILLAKNGETAPCGGPGVCRWCIEEGRR